MKKKKQEESLKIAMVIDARDPIIGGGQVHVRELCKSLIENHNCRVDLFVRSLQYDGHRYDKDLLEYDGQLRVLRCGNASNFFNIFARVRDIFSITNRIVKEHKQESYNLIHGHAYLGLASAKKASKRLKIPVVATIHGSNLLDKGTKSISYYIEKYLLTQIKYEAQITVGSHFLRYKNINNNIYIIGNGTSLKKFAYPNRKYPSKAQKFLFVGRLERTKGIDILIEAVSQIDTKLLDQNNIQFRLVGYGYSQKKYQKLVKKRNVLKYINFVGKKTGNELVKEYHSADIFILPSRTEGFPITTIEAMASGLPVIATKCGGPEDIINNRQNGFLIEANNSKQLRDIIVNAIIGKLNFESVGISGLNKVKKRYTRKIIAEKTLEVYKDIIKDD